MCVCVFPAGSQGCVFPAGKLDELHGTVLGREQPGLPYTPEESRLLDFHYSNLEFACGAPLSKVAVWL